MSAKSEDEVTTLLRQILGVLSLQVAKDLSVTDGARALKFAGLDNQTIANLLNTSPATIRVVTSNLRAKARTPRLRKKG